MYDQILNILSLCLNAQELGISITFNCNQGIVDVWHFVTEDNKECLKYRIGSYRGMDDEEKSYCDMKLYIENLIISKNKEA